MNATDWKCSVQASRCDLGTLDSLEQDRPRGRSQRVTWGFWICDDVERTPEESSADGAAMIGRNGGGRRFVGRVGERIIRDVGGRARRALALSGRRRGGRHEASMIGKLAGGPGLAGGGREVAGAASRGGGVPRAAASGWR